MNHQLYEETIPVFILFLTNLEKILGRGKRFAKTGKRGVSEKKLLNGRLAPDMFNTIQQVGYAYFMALEVASTFTTKKQPELLYDEKSVSELCASLRKVVKYLKSIKAKDFNAPANKRIESFLSASRTFSPQKYVRELALPNFFFHVTTTYDILRHFGVPLKKEDYLVIK